MTEEANLYQQIGGEKAVRQLCKAFYDVMSNTPQTALIRQMHPEDIASSEEKLYLFLSGWLGGPNLYIERYGHPRLRRRHMPFSIGIEERDQWLYCMATALKSLQLDDALAQQLMGAFVQIADFMRNREDATA